MGSYTFSITQCANKLGPSAEPRHVFAALRRLQACNELEFALDTSEKGRIFHLKITEAGLAVFCGDTYDEIEGKLTNRLFESFSFSINSAAKKVLDIHYILDEVASTSVVSHSEDFGEGAKSYSLVRFQELTKVYFEQGLEKERLSQELKLLPATFFEVRNKDLEIDAYALLRDLPSICTDQVPENDPNILILGDPLSRDYSAIAITKFLHGIDTPRTPSSIFRNHPLFGKWKNTEFRRVLNCIRSQLELEIEES